MKIKTLELKDAELDWAISLALGNNHIDPSSAYVGNGRKWLCTKDGFTINYLDWRQSGPIVEDEWSSITRQRIKYSLQDLDFNSDGVQIGFMRCFVASRLGDEIDIPQDIISARTISIRP